MSWSNEADHPHLPVPGDGVGDADLLREPRPLVHLDVVHPPGEAGPLALVDAHHGDRDHAQAEQAIQAIRGGVVLVAVAELQLAAAREVHERLLLVDRLDERVVLQLAQAQRRPQGARDAAASGGARPHDLGFRQEGLLRRRRPEHGDRRCARRRDEPARPGRARCMARSWLDCQETEARTTLGAWPRSVSAAPGYFAVDQ